MSSKLADDTAAQIRSLIEAEGDAIAENTRLFNKHRYESFKKFGANRHGELRERARSIKEEAIENLQDLIERLTKSVEANGRSVYVAEDAANANQYVREVFEPVGAETVVKRKSMTIEEIQVNDAIKAARIDPVETDLGELVIQLAERYRPILSALRSTNLVRRSLTCSTTTLTRTNHLRPPRS